mgnify:CR=1 FL=1
MCVFVSGMATIFSQALLKFLYGTCLFDIPSADNHGPDAPPMCKSRVSRQAAFRLLETLLFGETANLHLVSQNLVQQHKGGTHLVFRGNAMRMGEYCESGGWP